MTDPREGYEVESGPTTIARRAKGLGPAMKGKLIGFWDFFDRLCLCIIAFVVMGGSVAYAKVRPMLDRDIRPEEFTLLLTQFYPPGDYFPFPLVGAMITFGGVLGVTAGVILAFLGRSTPMGWLLLGLVGGGLGAAALTWLVPNPVIAPLASLVGALTGGIAVVWWHHRFYPSSLPASPSSPTDACRLS